MGLDVGYHQLKNGWVLHIGQYHGTYTIKKSGVYGIWATRVTGGGFGDGIWTLRLLNGGVENYAHLAGGFTIRDCNNIVDIMETIINKYNIHCYN